MELTDEFEVPLAVGDAWAVLTDLARVARSLPGAQLDEVEGDEHRGRIRVKVGPIGVEYRGAARFVSQDPAAHVAELRAEGRESRGQGNAAATVRSRLLPSGDHQTRVEISTTLEISGRLAQFGRGALADVSRKLLGQFVDNLEADLSSVASTGAAIADSHGSGGLASVPEGGVAPSAPGPSGTAGTAAGLEGPAARIEPAVGAPTEGATSGEAINAVRLLAPVTLKRVVAPLLVIIGTVALWRRIGRHLR